PEEAEAILKTAARVDTTSGPMTSEQLIALGAEVGLTPEQILAAEKQHLNDRVIQAGSEQKSTLLAQYRARLSSKIKESVGSWLGGSLLMLAISYFTSGQIASWALLVIGIWGASTLSNVIQYFVNRPNEHDPRFLRWIDRNRSSDQATYVRNASAGKMLDEYFKTHDHLNSGLAVKFLVEEHDLEWGEAKAAVDYYYKLRAW
ncbi:MAG: hypothetical protein K8R88_04055, partial [Armatimonadetes bacterium]|nr:hypothetical protein [Armatimonadota bacterium]